MNHHFLLLCLLLLTISLLKIITVTVASDYFCGRCLDIDISPAPRSTITASTKFTFQFSSDIYLNNGGQYVSISAVEWSNNMIRDLVLNQPTSSGNPQETCIYLRRSSNGAILLPATFQKSGTDNKFSVQFNSLPSNDAFRLYISCRCFSTDVYQYDIDTTNLIYYATSGGTIPTITNYPHESYCDNVNIARMDVWAEPTPVPFDAGVVTHVNQSKVTIRMNMDMEAPLDTTFGAFTDQLNTHYELTSPMHISGLKTQRTVSTVRLRPLQVAVSSVERTTYVSNEVVDSSHPVRREAIQQLYDEYQANQDSIILEIESQEYQVGI